MLIIDKALDKFEADGTPIRVGIIGAGFMGSAVAMQIIKYTKGMRVAAIANRNVEKAENAYGMAGIHEVRRITTQREFDKHLEKGGHAVTDDPMLIARCPHIDILLEVTGTIDYALAVVLEAFKYKKHVLTMNAELDGTVGPILKVYADRAGVIYTNVDGDQPGVEMNLIRFVQSIGLTPVMSGNIKGLQDPYRTPETQAEFALKWGQKPQSVTSYADGTKMSFEQAVVANGAGFHVAKRGMWGPTVTPGTPLVEAVKKYSVTKIMKNPGIVDYLVGAYPNAGIFVLATCDDPRQQFFLRLYKVGEGPLYLFYNPYHLCHFEVPITIARAMLYKDATMTPLGKPYVEVVAIAKKNLKIGETIDGIGGFMSYGECENSQTVKDKDLLPIGLAEGCKLIKDVKKDAPIKFSDVVLPVGNKICDFYFEQRKFFDKYEK